METEVVSEPSCMSSSSLRETSSEAQMAKSRCDPVSMYELEVRKAKSLIALDSNFFRVVLQDFDLKKYTLMLSTKCVFLVTKNCHMMDWTIPLSTWRSFSSITRSSEIICFIS
uniref:Uncharacterized protein n=1 Tax=Clytia hemisphaerica TaxID=252671 RepID=A0A7M5WLN8_9CNID